MDITNYTWISTFDPNKPVQTPSSSNSSQQPSSSSSQQPSPGSQQSHNNDNKTVIILASLFGASGSAIILVCGFFIYRWIRKRGQATSLPGTTVDDLPEFPDSSYKIK